MTPEEELAALMAKYGLGGSTSAPNEPNVVTGPDGRKYLFDPLNPTAPPQPLPDYLQPARETVPVRTGLPATDQAAENWMYQTAPGAQRPAYTSPYDAMDFAVDSPQARSAALNGGTDFLSSWKVLAAAGLPDSLIKQMLLGDTSGGSGSSGVGYAQLAEQQKQNDIDNALAIYQSLAGEQERMDTLAAMEQKNQMDALPFMVDPTMTHFPGLNPSDPIIGQYGLTSAVPIQHKLFNPAAPPNPATQAAQEAMMAFQALTKR